MVNKWEPQHESAEPCSTVGNVTGNRWESDCRSRGRKFDPAKSHTFMEIDRKIISTVLLLPSAESFKKGCCQLQAKVGAQWLSGRVLDSRLRGRGFVPQRCQSVVVLERDTFILA